ncbi:RNA-directed DNA polymerase, eukaryota [Tanacetum coccineum]
MGSRRSKEDDVNRISISIYVTNFPENFSAKELFQSCKQYGHVVDSFIPRKRTKEGKRFGFVRFINVFNVDRLVNNLCTIWVGQFKLHANKARFQRATLNKGQGADHKKVANSSRPNSGDSGSSNSYVNAVKNHKSVDHDSPAIVLDEDCVLSKDLSSSLMGRIKEFASLTNLKNALMNEGFVDLNVSYLGELWVLLEFSSVKSKEAFRDNVGVSSWFSEIRQASFDINPDGRIVWVEIEGVPLKLWTLNTFKRIVTRWGNLIDTNDSDGNCFHSKRLCLFTKTISNIYENFKIIFRGKVYWIRAKEVPGWTPDLVEDSDEEELSDDDSLEEGMKNLEFENDCSNSFEVPNTVFENEGDKKSVNDFEEEKLNEDDGDSNNSNLKENVDESASFGRFKKSVAPSLAQKAKKDWAKELCVKNKVNFLAIQETKMEEIDLFSVRRGVWLLNGIDLMIIAVYAPHDPRDKRMLWDYLAHVINQWQGEVVIMGDFNEVRVKSDRFGTNFNVLGANIFNSFINSTGLGGSAFTWCHKFLSDHRPILLRESAHDYGPVPFRFFHHWIHLEGFNDFVTSTWNSAPSVDSNGMRNLAGKLKFLKAHIKIWIKDNKSETVSTIANLKKELNQLDAVIDKGTGTEVEAEKRMEVLAALRNIDHIHSMDLAQKAKIKWSIEGDENSNFFHGILNKKRNQMNIRGITIDGVWKEQPNDVKQEFLSHFQDRFAKPSERRANIDMRFPKTISEDQSQDLEREVSKQEIKTAVWGCGTDKSPGPDGFSFGFYRHFWPVIEHDVYMAVNHFFIHGEIPPGCNSSFIALIPKVPDANLVKDFRPISLIGSIYKIIAKILSNRLVNVLGDIVNEVQSAFIAERQMLDGPFILNEILQWCTKKKKKTLIFKVDFEKAFDSIRWDFLDDVLKEFGFRCKWRNWIQSCLTSSKGSILVNGCPTNEFQFYKGLKQGDPLSPFLFILVMESLHLSFQRIVNAGMFKGIVLDQSLCLSHMFYADDAIFLGEWSDGNISTLIHVLKCFFHASGLKINLNKSKIMGINVESAQVIQAAAKLGCLVLKCPFYYLGTRVGGSMTRVQAWQEIVEKVKSRLSKWKSKTLSIGGRLTLLKSVLGSIPVFHMSIFKVPSKVLHILESIRSHFFNGHDPGSKKASWVKWNNVLTDKKRGGLGVSSLFALNRGLMIKWVWKFLSQKDSLWTKVIVAIHGVGGKIHSEWTSTGKSCWLSILSEVRSLQRKGMYVFDYLTHKMGNGESTKFWLDHWHTRGIFKDIFPRLYALESSKDVTVSSKIGDTSLVCSFRRIPRGGIEQNQFDSLVELVRSVTIVPSADRWNWNLESTGIFSVASARRRIDEICLPNIGEETRWVKCVPIKINVLAWKIKTDALPTRFNISRRGIDIQDMSCPICDNAIESTDHLFFRCGLVRDIANKVLSWWNLDHANLNSYAEWKSWLVSIRMDSKLKKMFEGVWYSIWWYVWIYRNKLLFDERKPSKSMLIDNVIASSFYWCKYRSKASFEWNEWLKNPYIIVL